MVKMIPLYIVIVTVVAPIVFAGQPKGKKGLKNVQITFVIAAFVWAMLCLYVYPQYVVVE